MRRGIVSEVSGNETGSKILVETPDKELLMDEFGLGKRVAFLEECCGDRGE